MMDHQNAALTVLGTILLLVHLTNAHRPLLTRGSCDSDYNSSQSALPIPDPTISWAFKHYADCSASNSHGAVWSSFVNPNADFAFYVGVGVPPLERYDDVRANALIIGPGLPKLSVDVMESLPQAIRNDPIWKSDDEELGAYYHVAPQDQSTCNHLGTVMYGESTVRNERCDFYEPFGGTHSWRVLDADENSIPVQGATYHVVVFLQEDVSAKIGIALGTWVENFWNVYDIDTPSCTRSMNDFSEKNGDQSMRFPKVSCPALGEEEGVGSVIVDATELEQIQANEVCELGQVCPDFLDPELCVVGGFKYVESTMGACGGQRCPAAVNIWEMANMKMHDGMMDLEYTGDVEIDFVRSMIPHHVGAVHMCDALLNLTCTEVDAIDSLEGLVHLCNHINYEQQIEVGGMLKWLESKGLEEKAPCPLNIAMDVGMMTMDHHSMPESCGATTVESSAALIELNNKMMALMAVEYSCDHSVDFIRQMIPHHAAAIEMCDIVVEITEDEYLVVLCNNVTLFQKAEISWMYGWLSERDTSVAAPCEEECDASKFMTRPCEDLLSTSSFCHGLTIGSDGYCRCDETFADDQFSCDNVSYIQGVGVFTPAMMCKRTCGICDVDGMGDAASASGGDTSAWSGGNGGVRKLAAMLDEEGRSIWPHSCYKSMDHSMHNADNMHDGYADHDDDNDHSGHNMNGNDMHANDSHDEHSHDDHSDDIGDYELLPSTSLGYSQTLHSVIVGFVMSGFFGSLFY